MAVSVSCGGMAQLLCEHYKYCVFTSVSRSAGVYRVGKVSHWTSYRLHHPALALLSVLFVVCGIVSSSNLRLREAMPQSVCFYRARVDGFFSVSKTY